MSIGNSGDAGLLPRVFGWVLAILGGALLLGALIPTVLLGQARADWPVVEGEVVQLLKTDVDIDPRRESYQYTPIVKYATPSGERTCVSTNSSNPPRHAVGDSLSVRYDPDKVSNCQVEPWGIVSWALTGGAALFMVIVVPTGIWLIRANPVPAWPAGSEPGRRRTDRQVWRQRWAENTPGRVFVLVGAGCLLALSVSAVAVVAFDRSRSDWPTTEGTVVSYRDVEYSTPVGTRVCRDDSPPDSDSGFDAEPGDKIEVRYHPDDVGKCQIDPAGARWVPWMLGGMGVGFGVIFGGVGVLMLRSRSMLG
ncbi:MAG: DUF3592 domain-containing protein [Microlunatus sp.]